MSRRRLIVWGATAGVCLLLVLVVVLAPVQAANAVKGGYKALPKGVRDAVPDGLERGVGGAIDSMVRTLAGNDPKALIGLRVALESSEPNVGGWAAGAVSLAWTDLGHPEISYEVSRSRSPSPAGAEVALTAPGPNASVPLSGEGQWWLVVVPTAGGSRGSTNVFGPFGNDPSAPAAPVVDELGDPPGYAFALSWSQVMDTSGLTGYEVQRRSGSNAFESVAVVETQAYEETNLGNGEYTYRVRAINGAGVPSEWSAPRVVTVSAPMSNPGVGAKSIGIHANYTSFMHVWDLSNPSAYYTLTDIAKPEHESVRDSYLGSEWGIETQNATLRAIVSSVVGSEQNAFKIAEKLFVWLYEQTDYDHGKATGPEQTLFAAGTTLDRGGGICGDLAVLYITALRIAGVPARPVHGYLDNNVTGGEFHMWVEAYVGGEPANPWMTVDVSGASSDPSQALFLYFGLFNPDYLSLGTERVYDPVSAEEPTWNAWARFKWTCQGSCPRPDLNAGAAVVNLQVEEKFLLVNTQTRQRALVDVNGQAQPTPPPGMSCGNGDCFFWKVHSRVHKLIDYGVVVGPASPNLKRLDVELRYPTADDFAATNPYQSVIYTVYEAGSALQGEEESDGFVRLTRVY